MKSNVNIFDLYFELRALDAEYQRLVLRREEIRNMAIDAGIYNKLSAMLFGDGDYHPEF